MGDVIRLHGREVKHPKVEENHEWAQCPVCKSDQSNWDIIVAVTKKGKISVKSIICLSDICAGETIFNVQNGIIDP